MYCQCLDFEASCNRSDTDNPVRLHGSVLNRRQQTVARFSHRVRNFKPKHS